jgi:NADH-quinone oxidoreductase subunit C
MTVAEILAHLEAAFPNMAFQIQSGEAGDSWLLIQPSDVVQILAYLKNKLSLTYLVTLAGVDYGNSLGVVYVLRSLESRDEIIVKALLDRENARINTVSHLYGVANWFEREAFDLLGIKFENHPDRRRLMMPDDWEGHPLRKDYRYPTSYHGISCARPDSHSLLDPMYAKSPVSDKSKTAKADESGLANPAPAAASKEFQS